MTNSLRISTLSVTLALVASSCSSGDSNAVVTTSGFSVAAQVRRHIASTAGDLYVANAYVNTVTAYQPGGSSPVQTIVGTPDDPIAPSALALDLHNLYVANSASGINSVTVYARGAKSPKYTIRRGIANPQGLAVGSNGGLYVMNAGNGTVSVYGKSQRRPRYIVTNGIDGPQALALDSYGDLFVANYNGNTVTVYAPGTTRLIRTISQGVKTPDALAFDNSGNLYVANFNGASVTVYGPGAPSPLYTITTGLSQPDALALDSSADLFAADHDTGSITAYQPGSSIPWYTISDNSGANALTVDGLGNLYAGNSIDQTHGNSVSVYGPGQPSASYTITNGIGYLPGNEHIAIAP
jgi:sugar lactone lactonase YvrE